MAICVQILPAEFGDCILVSHTDENQTVFNILIDGGLKSTFSSQAAGKRNGPLKKALDTIIQKNQSVDLAILTHVDNDHIGGLLAAFKREKYLKSICKKIWFNSSKSITDAFSHSAIPENEVQLRFDGSTKTSVPQGQTLERLLTNLKIWDQQLIQARQEPYTEGPFKITVLSPSKSNLEKLLVIWPNEQTPTETSSSARDHHILIEKLLENDTFEPDPSITNGSSIAFILEADGVQMLFLGDAHVNTLVENLKTFGFTKENPLNAALVKISHHGSRNNTSNELLDLINCSSFIISTNGVVHKHPDKITIARILAHNNSNFIYANYDIAVRSILDPTEKVAYGQRIQIKTEFSL